MHVNRDWVPLVVDQQPTADVIAHCHKARSCDELRDLIHRGSWSGRAVQFNQMGEYAQLRPEADPREVAQSIRWDLISTE